MAQRFRVPQARLLAVALAAVALVVSMGASVAFAADSDEPVLDPALVPQLLEQLQAAPVVEENCGACHGNIADTDNYASEIIFTHGNHIALQCSSCHTRFPHRQEGTQRPTMKGCFDCHGLQHGPDGELATGKCNDCHVTDKARLRPSFHPYDWAGKPHVDPSNKEFNTRCAMCHEPASCTECHDRQGIEWRPSKWEYDSDGGCMSCHGSALLQKQGLAGSKSYQVSGLGDSVHQSVTCQGCHIDFRYDEQKAATPLWTVNVSQACADCHKNADTGDSKEDERLSAPVAEYEGSVHAEAIADGKLDSATCGSCHGGHYIFSTKTEIGKQRMHLSAYRVCSRCKQHGDDYDTYDDYYHGKAYKANNPDAPACWDCHGSHAVLAKEEPESLVYQSNIGITCGQEGCHQGTDEKFGADSGELIHQKAAEQQNNPLVKLVGAITGR